MNEQCQQPNAYCELKFSHIIKSLDELKSDLKADNLALHKKIENGLNTRLQMVETDLDRLKEDRRRRSKFVAIVQTSVVGLMISASAALVMHMTKTYFQSAQQERNESQLLIQQLLKQLPKDK